MMATAAEALLMLWLLSPTVTAKAESNYVYSQAGKTEDLHSEYKQLMDAAKTPEDKARAKEEYDRRLKERVPKAKDPAHPEAGTSGSVAIPKRDGGSQLGR